MGPYGVVYAIKPQKNSLDAEKNVAHIDVAMETRMQISGPAHGTFTILTTVSTLCQVPIFAHKHTHIFQGIGEVISESCGLNNIVISKTFPSNRSE